MSLKRCSIASDGIDMSQISSGRLDVPLMMTTKAFLKIATTSLIWRLLLYSEVNKCNEPSSSQILVFIFRYTGLPVQLSMESYYEIVMCTSVHVNNLACFVTQFKYFFFSISLKVTGLCLGVVAQWPFVGITVWRKLVLSHFKGLGIFLQNCNFSNELCGLWISVQDIILL